MCTCTIIGGSSIAHLLRFDLRVDVWELLCQFLFLWLMNQLLICFSCRPVSSTSFALSSSCIYQVGWITAKNGDHTQAKTPCQPVCACMVACIACMIATMHSLTHRGVWPLGVLLPPLLEDAGGVPRQLPGSPLPQDFLPHILYS